MIFTVWLKLKSIAFLKTDIDRAKRKNNLIILYYRNKGIYIDYENYFNFKKSIGT